MNSLRVFSIYVLGAMALALGASAALAAPITSIPGGTVIPFPSVNQYFGAGPKTVAPGVTWTSTHDRSVYGFTQGSYGLATNGTWTGQPPLIGLNTRAQANSPQYMTISFDTPVSAVGAFLNYAPENGVPTILVRDSFGALLEAMPLLIATPGAQNGGEFWGFALDTAVISSFIMSDAFIVARNLTISRTYTAPSNPVPAPGALALLGLGLLGFGAIRRRSVPV